MFKMFLLIVFVKHTGVYILDKARCVQTGLTDLCINALRIMGSHYFQALLLSSTSMMDDKKSK